MHILVSHDVSMFRMQIINLPIGSRWCCMVGYMYAAVIIRLLCVHLQASPRFAASRVSIYQVWDENARYLTVRTSATPNQPAFPSCPHLFHPYLGCTLTNLIPSPHLTSLHLASPLTALHRTPFTQCLRRNEHHHQQRPRKR